MRGSNKQPITPAKVAARRKTLYLMCLASIPFGLLSLAAGGYLLATALPTHLRTNVDLFTLIVGIGLILFGFWRLGLAGYYLYVLRKMRLIPPIDPSRSQQT